MPKTRAKKNEKNSVRNGFLYPAIDWFLDVLKYLCLVEGYKFVGRKLAGKNKELSVSYSRIAVDLFIASKWLFLMILWVYRVANSLTTLLVWYLLLTNLYSYFYYHTWSSDLFTDKYFDVHRIKRRFNGLILAISYAMFGFAYLYNIPYSNEFEWSGGSPTFFKSLWLSISNSLTAGYDQVRPVTDLGYSLSMIQLLMMFIFLTIIVAGSVPQTNQINKEG